MSCWCAEPQQAHALPRGQCCCSWDWCGRVWGCELITGGSSNPGSFLPLRPLRAATDFLSTVRRVIPIEFSSLHFLIFTKSLHSLHIPELFEQHTWWFSLLCLPAGAKQVSPHRYHKAFSTPVFPRKINGKMKLRSRIYMSDKYTNITMQANRQKVTVIPPHLRDSLNLCERCVLLSQTSTGFVSMKRSWNSSISGVIWPTVITVQE